MNKTFKFLTALLALAINAVYKNTDSKVQGIRQEVTQQVTETKQGFENEVSGIKTAVAETGKNLESTRQEFGQQVGEVKQAVSDAQIAADQKFATKADLELEDLSKYFRSLLLEEIQKEMGEVPEEKSEEKEAKEKA